MRLTAVGTTAGTDQTTAAPPAPGVTTAGQFAAPEGTTGEAGPTGPAEASTAPQPGTTAPPGTEAPATTQAPVTSTKCTGLINWLSFVGGMSFCCGVLAIGLFLCKIHHSITEDHSYASL